MRFVGVGWTIFQSKFLRNRLQKNGLKNVYDGLSYGTTLENSICAAWLLLEWSYFFTPTSHETEAYGRRTLPSFVHQETEKYFRLSDRCFENRLARLFNQVARYLYRYRRIQATTACFRFCCVQEKYLGGKQAAREF